MKIVVCMKQVPDLAQLRFKSDPEAGTSRRVPVLNNLPVHLGSFDRNALEAAVSAKEAGLDTLVLALSVGVGRLRETIKHALASGADEAVVVSDPALGACGAAGSARVLAAAIQKVNAVDLVLMGEGSDDDYTGQIPSRVAALLDLPQITYVRELEIRSEGEVRATRDLDAELEVVECALPAVVSVTSELNTPRIPPLTAVMKAGRKPLHEWTLAELGVAGEESAVQLDVLDNLAPAQERRNLMLDGAPEEQAAALLRALEQDGVLR